MYESAESEMLIQPSDLKFPDRYKPKSKHHQASGSKHESKQANQSTKDVDTDMTNHSKRKADDLDPSDAEKVQSKKETTSFNEDSEQEKKKLRTEE